MLVFCNLAPPSKVKTSFTNVRASVYNIDVLHYFELSSAIELTLPAAKQATLNLSHGGLGLRSLHRHAPAAYLYIFNHVSGLSELLLTSNMVSQSDAISVGSVLDVPPRQHTLSSHIEEADINFLFFKRNYCVKDQIAYYFSTPSPCMA